MQGLGHDDGGDGGAGGGEDGGEDDFVGVLHSGGGEVVDGGHGDQGEGGGVESEERDHGVAGGLLVRIELLEVVHGFEAERGGAVAEAEHVGGEVHDHGAEGGVTGGDLGEEAAHEGVEEMGDGGEEAGLFHQAHGAEPEHHHAREGQCDAHDGGFGHIEGGGDDSVFTGEVAEEAGDEDAAEDDSGPDVVQHGREIKGGAGCVNRIARKEGGCWGNRPVLVCVSISRIFFHVDGPYSNCQSEERRDSACDPDLGASLSSAGADADGDESEDVFGGGCAPIEAAWGIDDEGASDWLFG